jgi:hypothetical protein
MPRGFSDYDSARIQGRLWTPQAPALALWLDAADPATVTADSNGVSAWKDKTGLLSDYTQTTNSKKPALVRHVASGGLPALSFDGTDDILESTTGITSGTYTGILTLFYAATRSSTSGLSSLFVERVGANFCAWEWSYGPNYIGYGGERCKTHSNTDRTMNFMGPARFNGIAGKGGIICQTHEPAKKDVARMNGFEFSSELAVYRPAEVPNIDGTAGSSIGGQPFTQTYSLGFWPGQVCEIIAMTGTLPSRDRDMIEGYLGWKWGYRLDAAHPYANRPPLIGD